MRGRCSTSPSAARVSSRRWTPDFAEPEPAGQLGDADARLPRAKLLQQPGGVAHGREHGVTHVVGSREAGGSGGSFPANVRLDAGPPHWGPAAAGRPPTPTALCGLRRGPGPTSPRNADSASAATAGRAGRSPAPAAPGLGGVPRARPRPTRRRAPPDRAPASGSSRSRAPPPSGRGQPCADVRGVVRRQSRPRLRRRSGRGPSDAERAPHSANAGPSASSTSPSAGTTTRGRRSAAASEPGSSPVDRDLRALQRPERLRGGEQVQVARPDGGDREGPPVMQRQPPRTAGGKCQRLRDVGPVDLGARSRRRPRASAPARHAHVVPICWNGCLFLRNARRATVGASRSVTGHPTGCPLPR